MKAFIDAVPAPMSMNYPDGFERTDATHVDQITGVTRLFAASDLALGLESNTERLAHVEASGRLLGVVVVEVPAAVFHILYVH